MKSLGYHVMLELFDCDRKILNDVNKIEEHMIYAAKKAGATIISSSFHHFSPQGVSGVVVIAESHLAIHTWPEYGYAAVDLFTCGDSVNPWIAFEYLSTKLSAEKWETSEVPRGAVDKIRASCGITEEIKYKIS